MKALHSSTSNFEKRGRRAFFAMCWAAVLVVAVDLLCRAILPAGWLVKMEDLTRERAETQATPDIQVVGDSVVRTGLIASALGNDRLTVRNDGMAASGTPKTYLLLARQFEKGHVPRALVIAHSPHTFGQVRYEVLVGGFAYWREIPELVPYADPWTEVLYGALTKLSYVLMHRDSFQDLLKRGDASFFKETEQGIFLPPDEERLQKFDKRVASGEFAKNRLPGQVSDYYRSRFTVDKFNDIYFRKILQLAKQHGVKVFWVTLPTPPQIMEARSSVNYEEELLQYLRQFEAPGEFEILKGPFSVYRAELFTDVLHLNEAGAVQFACELEKVKAPVVAAATGAHAIPASMDYEDKFRALLAPFCVREGSSQKDQIAAAY